MSRAGLLFVGNFLSTRGTNPTYSEDMTARLEVREWPIVRTSSQLGKARRLGGMIHTVWKRRRDYSLAHIDVFSGPAFVWAEAVCFELQRLRKPYILTLRGGNLPDFLRRWPRRTRSLLRSADAVTTPSRYLKEAMATVDADIDVLPNAIDVSAYWVGKPSAVPRLIWLRAFHAIYNPLLAVEVLARLPSSTTLKMIGVDKGDGSLQAVERRARELHVSDRLQVLRGIPKTEVARHLAEATVFLNTTNVDNSPISVIEAMASGLRVISTNVGGIPYLIDHGRTGLLVAPRDPVAMSHAVLRVIDDLELSDSLSANCREEALGHDWSPILAQWERLFSRVIANV